jgi:hypothetical protein
VIALTLFINLIIQIYITLQGIDMIDIGELGVLVPSFENRGAEGLRSVQAEPLGCVIPAWSAGIQVNMDVSGASCESGCRPSMPGMTRYPFSCSVKVRI